MRTVLLPVAFLLIAVPLAHAENGSWADLNGQVVSHYKQAQYSQAATTGEQAVKAAEATYGPDHPNVAISLNNLGAAYISLGQYDKAEVPLKRALEIDNKLYGPNHPSSIADRANLDAISAAKGQQAAAAPAASAPSAPKSAAAPKAPAQQSPAQSRDSDSTGWDAPYEQWQASGYANSDDKPRSYDPNENVAIEEEKQERWYEFEFGFENGFRVDKLQWNIAGNLNGSSPNILSELTWKNVQSYQVKGTTKFTVKDWFFLRGGYTYGWILDGANQDSDYNLNNRRGEFSRSNNSTDDGDVEDMAIAVGYPFKPIAGDYELKIHPFLGYSYHRQRYVIRNGKQTIPASGPFDGLDSEYEATWRGQFIGFDTSVKVLPKVRFFGTFQYHWARYRGQARWNLRTDFDQPLSFEHHANAQGIAGQVGLEYLFNKYWSFFINSDIQYWHANRGIDRTYFIGGGTIDTQLNEANWHSVAVNGGAKATF